MKKTMGEGMAKKAAEGQHITRRAALLGTATAAAAMLAGCSKGGGEEAVPEDEQQDAGWTPDNGAYLPLGSVVKVSKLTNPNIKLMITARRPLNNLEGTETIPDYAGVLWPFGRLSNIDDAPWEGDIVTFDNEDISELLFTGYITEEEERAALELVAAGDGVGAYILNGMLKELNGSN